jgi:hypothetical protein
LMATWPAEVAPTIDAHFGDKQGLENQHINGGGMFTLGKQMPDNQDAHGRRNRDIDSYNRGSL